jgi:amino-acid N-acetyltransferase
MSRIRKATLKDVKEIHAILSNFARKGELLARPLSALYERIREFYILKEEDRIIGCVALSVIWEDLAEIRSLAVQEDFQKKGIGKELVEACIREAEDLEIKRVFTLTYKPGFFEKLGFRQVDKHELPHKIWADCIHCHQFPDCTEIALLRSI